MTKPDDLYAARGAPSHPAPADVLVIGGGLGGLTTATLLARGGRRVTLLERSRALGGRAKTTDVPAARLNLGPHALYRGGPAERVLRGLAIPYAGGRPPNGGLGLAGGVPAPLPGGPWSLLSTKLLPAAGKLELSLKLPLALLRDPSPLAEVPATQWIDDTFTVPAVRQLMRALFRLSTYVACLDVLSTEVALRQLTQAMRRGVTYLDGGWGTLVDGLRSAASDAGVTIETGARVDQVVAGAQPIAETANGPRPARQIVIATGATAAQAALPTLGLDPTPSIVACLDLVLSTLPAPRQTLLLGIDQPLYASVHSAHAALTDEGCALICIAHYLGGPAPLAPPHGGGSAREPIEGDASAGTVGRAPLERFADLMQPGWRDALLHQRFLPRVVACSAIPRADQGGLRGRPQAADPSRPNVLVVGDWVGAEGHLADATFASADDAAQHILTQPGLARAA